MTDRTDQGITLIEVVVSMAIMTVLMSIFTTGVIQMYRVANRTEALNVTQAQVVTAFNRMDKEIRYATAISTPAQIGDAFYVEYTSTNSSGATECTRLSVDTGDRLMRMVKWQGSYPTTPVWTVLATNVTASQAPFVLVAGLSFQRLQVRIEATYGTVAAGSTGAVKSTDVTFTAVNTTNDPANALVCQDGRPTS